MHLVVPPGGNFPETRRIELGPTALTIGRSEGCEVRVDVPGVDSEHAKISEVALIALGPDCAIGDVPLEQGSRRLLMPGDEIQIGSIVVVLEGDDPNAHDGAGSGDSKLMTPRIRVVEGSNFGDELLMREENRQYVIGRGAKCDLVIDDREVSREHVKLIRRGFSVFVQDQSSTRGSWLGRSAVYSGATVEWSRPRMMRVGATVLSLELPEFARRAAPAAQPSAPMTPPPRSKTKSVPQAMSSSPELVSGPDSSPMPASVRPLTHTAPMPMVEAATQKVGAFSYEPPPAPAAISSMPAPVVYTPKAPMPAPLPPAPVIQRDGALSAQYGGAAAVNNSMPLGVGSQPLGLSPPMMMTAGSSPAQRKAWKKNGPVIGRFSGLLLLALAGLAILGALFVVFSLLE